MRQCRGQYRPPERPSRPLEPTAERRLSGAHVRVRTEHQRRLEVASAAHRFRRFREHARRARGGSSHTLQHHSRPEQNRNTIVHVQRDRFWPPSIRYFDYHRTMWSTSVSRQANPRIKGLPSLDPMPDRAATLSAKERTSNHVSRNRLLYDEPCKADEIFPDRSLHQPTHDLRARAGISD